MNFIFRRLGIALLTVVLVSFLSFIAFDIIPGDPVSVILGTEASSEQIAALREELGLDRNIFVRYIFWLKNFCSGNPGNSIRFRGEPVAAMIQERLPVSIALAVLSLVFILLIAVPVSVFSVQPHRNTAHKRFHAGTIIDRIINALTAFGVSIPGFFLGVLFIWIFGISFKWFIPGVYTPYQENFFGFISSLVFPALAVAIPNAAVLIKFLRSNLLHELKSDYVRTVRSKGAGSAYTLHRHALKNALIPTLAVLGMIIAEIFSGSIVIEQVFTIPGIGRLLIAVIRSHDFPVIQALVVYIAWTVVIANTLVDIAIQMIDPRIRLGKQTFREVVRS